MIERVNFIPDIGLHVITPQSAVYGGPVASIGGCVLWLRADMGTFQDAGATTPATNDLDKVRLWQDQSGAGFHREAPADSARPQLRLAIQNGQSVLQFDGTTDLFESTQSYITPNSTIFFVVKGQRGLFSRSDRWYGHGLKEAGWGWVTTDWTGSSNYAHNAFMGVSPSTAFHQYAFVFTNGGDCPKYVDGNLVGTHPAAQNSSSRLSVLDNIGFSYGTTGDGGDYGGQRFMGQIAEIIVYNSSLSDVNRGLVESYISTRYAL